MDNIKDQILSILEEGTGSQNIRYDSTDDKGVLWFYRTASTPQDQFDDLVNTIIEVSNSVKAELEVKNRHEGSTTETLPVTNGRGRDDFEDRELTKLIRAIPEIALSPSEMLYVPDSFHYGDPHIFTAIIGEKQVHFAIIDELVSPSITFRCNNPKKLMKMLKGIAKKLDSRVMTKGVSDYRSGYVDKPISFLTNKKDSISIEKSFKGDETEGYFRIQSSYWKERGFRLYVSASNEWITASTVDAIKQIIGMIKSKV